MRTNELKFATLITIDRNKTEKMFKKTFYADNDNYIQAVGYEQNGAMACEYDMGGPIVAGYTLVGIISWDLNRTCSFQNQLPTSVLRISPHIFWINEILYNSKQG